jgi:hypothetical protein
LNSPPVTDASSFLAVLPSTLLGGTTNTAGGTNSTIAGGLNETLGVTDNTQVGGTTFTP